MRTFILAKNRRNEVGRVVNLAKDRRGVCEWEWLQGCHRRSLQLQTNQQIRCQLSLAEPVQFRLDATN